MEIPRPRLSVRAMIGLVALAAMLVWGWMTYFDPVRLWKEAIRDKYDANRRNKGIDDAVNGRISGITPDMAIGEFVALLSDKRLNPMILDSAIAGLAMFKEKAKAAIPALIGALGDDSPGIRISAGLAIWRITAPLLEEDPTRREAVRALITALDDPDRRVRRWSACFLGWIGEGEVAVPALAEALKQPDLNSMERMQILDALGRSGPKAVAAVPAVLEMLAGNSIDEGNPGSEVARRGNAEAQIQAAKFLHASGEAGQAVEILQQLAKDRDPLIGGEAEKVLGTLKPAGSGDPGGLEP